MRSIFTSVVLGVSIVVAATPQLAAVAAIQQPDAQALQRMVATERAFAAATAEVGVRDGFLSFFADDSIQIRRDPQPALVPAREALASQPLQKLPVANQLIWEPFTGQIASDGMLGWLTGGYVSMNQAQRVTVAQGAYFSVWKRQANGTWRVWLDEGIALPQIWQGASPFRVAPDPDTGTTGAASETLSAAETSVASSLENWRARLGADVRRHIDGRMPLAGREAVTTDARSIAPVTYTVLRTEAAGSGDLAITIGTFESKTSAAPARGTWIRVWKRDVTSRWRIVFQTDK